MNLMIINFFLGLFLSIKYSEGKLITTDESIHNSIFYQLTNKTDNRINISDLNFCEGCCDDLNEYEIKENIENRLDLNFFNNIEALKRDTDPYTDIYKQMKLCVTERPLISCVDLCLCKNEKCINERIKRFKKILRRAYNCTKKELKMKNKQLTINELNNLVLDKCWHNLTRDEIFRLKSKLIEKTDLFAKSDEDNQSDQSYEQNNSIEEQPNKASPITNNSINLYYYLNYKLIFLFIILSIKNHY